MNAFRKARLIVLLGLVAVLALSLSVGTAEAGGHKHFHNFHHFGHKHFHYDHYWPTHYQPIVKYTVKPISYPVTYYDCYGQPYVVWQTTYNTVPINYLP